MAFYYNRTELNTSPVKPGSLITRRDLYENLSNSLNKKKKFCLPLIARSSFFL